MNAKSTASSEAWYPPGARPTDRTSQTDDQRIEDITVLPPPEHLIRFFPIRGTAIETLISRTRKAIRKIVHGKDDRMLVIIGPCSIHDPAAAIEYARKLLALREQYEAARDHPGSRELIDIERIGAVLAAWCAQERDAIKAAAKRLAQAYVDYEDDMPDVGDGGRAAQLWRPLIAVEIGRAHV